MFRNRPKAILIAMATIFTTGGTNPIHAQVALVARDSNNLYQKGRFSHVKRVLLYNYTLGGENPAYLRNSMTRLANKYGFQLDQGSTSTYITPATLAIDSANHVDVTIFCNGDGDVLQSAVSLAAMKTFVEVHGKGLLQSHRAAGYVPCPTSGTENLDDPNCKWLARVLVRQYLAHDPDPHMARIYADSTRAGEVPPGGGATPTMINHGKSNPEFQGIFKGLPDNDGVVRNGMADMWDSVGDEWFNYRGYVRQQGAQIFNGVLFGPIVCLLSLDESAPYWTTTIARMGDRVEAWGRHVGNGLTVYNNAGHSDVYVRPRRNGHVNDSVMEKINWNMIRYLARDFVGCMDSGYREYNPEATISFITPGIDDTLPCKTLNTTSIRVVKGGAPSGIMLTSHGIQISIPDAGAYRIILADANGKQIFSKTISGGLNKKAEISSLNKGVYFVEVHSPKNKSTVTRIKF